MGMALLSPSSTRFEQQPDQAEHAGEQVVMVSGMRCCVVENRGGNLWFSVNVLNQHVIWKTTQQRMHDPVMTPP